jgi:hypothetical protein
MISYKKLWHVLLDKDLKKKDLVTMAGISTFTISKLNRGGDGDSAEQAVLRRVSRQQFCLRQHPRQLRADIQNVQSNDTKEGIVMAKNNENKIQIRNSANDFLVFSKENGGDGVDVLVADENVWLTQKSICTLYEASKSNVSEHLTAIFASGELGEDSVVRKFRTTASDGKQYTQKYYNLQAIIAVGFKINSEKAIHFRAWAAEIIVERADATKDYMGLTTWEAAPKGKIRKSDVTIAKNYLGEQEMQSLERIVTAYLEFAEFQATRQVPMSQDDWKKRLDLFLQATGTDLLANAGKVSALEAKIYAEGEFDKYRVIQDRLFSSDFDKFLEEANIEGLTCEANAKDGGGGE